jgi:hypothetical protein
VPYTGKAIDVARSYSQSWRIETSFCEFKPLMMGMAPALRSKKPIGLE